ncbi:YifB family Mg chelatase-like AAA ATPase [Limibaculum sp. M0105]|uniref:YifB family Mg chelatase-like AAA ATPase n=1 Tax=Thermohalobaculum xanthum TaxID=2753746 RepID=A0A8J7MBE9_9RHOB|nr:YifB family Mg chelatase-like AAA ATPase [Thermohalobaculum xanthum]MBK0401064.1 YifB family Mg chelatase-like AAA ATPase [Thermohalobaculum xanthum]
MLARVHTVAFLGVEARPVEVQCVVSPGLPAFQIVGLPDKAVSESRERVRAALTACGLALPPQRITVNLSPADLPKAGSHFDLPIALALMAALEVIPRDEAEAVLALGELSLDGQIRAVQGALPAALAAAEMDKALVCAAASGPEAAWVGAAEILAPDSLLALTNHFRGRTALIPPEPGTVSARRNGTDLLDVKGQEGARRALEVAAAGNHNILMVGEPGSGKSMLATRLTSIMPPLTPREALEVSIIHSLAAEPGDGGMMRERPYRSPHHSASMAAMVGGGRNAKPGEISLAHRGVLFLDELPEFARPVLEALRQPIETGEAVVARAEAHVKYPARFLLAAAMNPCRCGYLGDAARSCSRAPKCGADYMARLSGPLIDRFDIRIEVPPVTPEVLALPTHAEGSARVAARVAQARAAQAGRGTGDAPVTNGELDGEALERVSRPDDAGRQLLQAAAEKLRLSARGYHRVLRLARTIADLDGADAVRKPHIAEAVGYRRALS